MARTSDAGARAAGHKDAIKAGAGGTSTPEEYAAVDFSQSQSPPVSTKQELKQQVPHYVLPLHAMQAPIVIKCQILV